MRIVVKKGNMVHTVTSQYQLDAFKADGYEIIEEKEKKTETPQKPKSKNTD